MLLNMFPAVPSLRVTSLSLPVKISISEDQRCHPYYTAYHYCGSGFKDLGENQYVLPSANTAAGNLVSIILY